MNSSSKAPRLRRELGVFGATMLGLGSIVGTGVFVRIGIGAEAAGPSVLLAIALASLLAICNGLSSAQLAANHPVSGGTYEYGHKWLSPWLGFTAGWMFLGAKSASAATAALGFAGYLLQAIDQKDTIWLPGVAAAAVVVLTVISLCGVQRSSTANVVIVAVTLLSLTFFVVVGGGACGSPGQRLTPFFAGGGAGLLQATALMFVAYTGYGRIATLGEEVREPQTTIPRAVIVTLAVSMVLYVSVAFVAVATVGAEAFAQTTHQQAAPLETIASRFPVFGSATVLAVGAITAMLGVLLNLLLGLSRVLLAMGRRNDAPAGLAAVSERSGSPWAATLTMAAVVSGLALLGDVRLTWSFSALTVLVYYALTNLCALRLRPEERLFSIWPTYCGLAGCVFLAFWIDGAAWLIGGGFAAVGCLWRLLWRSQAA